jgi:FtsH-binding integral membrane protein
MVVNFFLNSSMFDYVISIFGVIIFTGLTAYDVQKLKRIGAQLKAEGESSQKMVIMGALTLYLDFINLFLFLLRLFGNRK